jgi:uncharacterized repeat protein (TIGR01451 family)
MFVVRNWSWPVELNFTGLLYKAEIEYEPPAGIQEVPEIQIEKMVYAGHSNGAGCDTAGDMVVGLIGDEVTYCFTVTNTGGTFLNSITINDVLLGGGVTTGDLTPDGGNSNLLAPGLSNRYYYETTIQGNLLNTAVVEGNPCNDQGIDITELANVTDDDSAAVAVCGEQSPCGPCDGQATLLKLRYNGPEDEFVVVRAGRGKWETVLFAGLVAAGGEFLFTGQNNKNMMGSEIRIWVDGEYNARIHTSCSQPLGPGLIAGDFEVIAGESSDGGPLCPLP